MSSLQESSSKINVRNDQSSQTKSKTYSPRKVAASIGVSESSLKRWCDSGYISALKTAGGHRRISPSEVVAFIKRRKQTLVQPESIGLPSLDGVAVQNSTDAVNQFFNGLLQPDSLTCRRLLLFLFINNWEVAEIVDHVIRPALERVGEKWERGEIEVYEERHACLICQEAIREIAAILPNPAPSARTAIGGAIEEDYYDVPTLALELTLNAMGWRATSLGNNLPLDSLLAAARQYRPDLLWVSVSHVAQPHTMLERLNQFADQVPPETTLVIGGRSIDASFRNGIKNAICCDNFSQLSALARKLASSTKSSLHPNDFQRSTGQAK